MRITNIRLVHVQPPEHINVNTELQWLGKSLGLFGDRDKEKSCYRVFITLVNRPEDISSDEIAKVTNLTRGTVVHHLNKLKDAGLIRHTPIGYRLAEGSIQAAVQNIRKDVNAMLDALERVAKDVDERL